MSFWRLFRIVFVVFSLYLMGDAFYRWDGFRYYGTFSEFVPGVALASALWSIVAVITAMVLFLALKVVERVSRVTGIVLKMEYVFFNLVLFVISGVIALGLKRLIWHNITTPFQIKLIVFISILFISIFVTWLVRNSGVNPIV